MTRSRWSLFAALVLTTVLLFTIYLVTTLDRSNSLVIKKKDLIYNFNVDNSIYTEIHSHTASAQFSQNSYLLSLYTLEQLTMSSMHFYSLVNLAYTWNLTAVEPVVCNSRMFGLRNMSTCKNGKIDQTFEEDSYSTEVDFGQLYNLTYLQHNLSRCLSAVTNMISTNVSLNSEALFVDSLDNFLKYSYRDIVLVHFIHMPGGIAGDSFISVPTLKKIDKELSIEFIHSGAYVNERQSVIDCSSRAKTIGLLQQVEEKLNSNLFRSPQARADIAAFKISHVICVDFKNPNMSLFELKEIITTTRRKVTGNMLELEASVVFTKWQNVGPLKEPKNAHVFSSCNSRWPIPHSEGVVLASEQFITSLKVTRPFLSVHMRLERLYQCELHTQGYMDCCLERFASLMNELSFKYGIDPGNVVMIKDYGAYGTDSCIYKDKSVCLSITEGVVKQLKMWEYNFVEFDPRSIPGAPHSSGFVSLVEAHSLLYGEALVTLGFGSFQGSIIRKFAQTTSLDAKSGFLNISDHIYRICPCTLLRGHIEKLNGIELGTSCESTTTNAV